MYTLACKTGWENLCLLNIPVCNLKPFQEALEYKGEMNKQFCQNDLTLASTMILIRKEDQKDIRKLTHKEHNERLFEYQSVFHVYVPWMNIDMIECD